ncbi:tyrosine-type recombinase/integrase [Enterococcus ratti]|uniref:tyrosine-type recombinase/integrase n=1 Tax=Enterococcus ratti TaxID=150033 RepID=UPI0009003718
MISIPLTIHGLRHKHASILIFKGINIMAVSKRLGHKNLSVTTKTYSHVVKEVEEREVEKNKGVFQGMLKIR